MDKALATLEIGSDIPMNLHATHLHSNKQPPGGTMKFTYASGSRPLDGFTIKRGVGRGGFGEVYYATSDAGKEVALKLIRRNLEVEIRGVTQCLNLKHPHLVGLYDIKQDDLGDSWVVMEFVSGESLEDLITRHPSGMPVDLALRWFQGVSGGVAYLHDRGIVHRDLKPGNIFSDEGIVKIGDYGLSKFLSASRRSGQTESVGTVHYMAPEIANGRYGKEIDIYALGIILYEMLTGHVPFEGESVGEVLMKHLTAEPDLRGVQEPFRTAIGRTLAKDPALRINSVAELLAAVSPGTVLTSAVASGSHDVNVIPSSALPNGGVARLGSATATPTYFASMPPAALQQDTTATVQAGPAPSPPPVPPLPAPEAIVQGFEGAVVGFFSSLRRMWTVSSIPTRVVVIAGLMLFAFTSGDLEHLIFSAEFLAFVVFVTVVYGVIRFIMWLKAPFPETPPRRHNTPRNPRDAGWRSVEDRAQAIAPSQPAAPIPQTVPVPAVAYRAPPPKHTPRRASHWRRHRVPARPQLPSRSGREKLTELLGSLLLAATVAAISSMLLVMLRSNATPDVWAWLTLSAIGGVWPLLIAAKVWEGTNEDQSQRRFVMLSLGLLCGAIAYFTSDLLFLELSYHWDADALIKRNDLGKLYGDAGQPLLLAHMGYFGLLLVITRWWRMADPLRASRLSIGGVAIPMLAAWVISHVLPYPQPWGLMVAGLMAVTLQLSSPWYDWKRAERATENS